MRAVGLILGLALTLAIPPIAGPAMADEDRPPTKAEVRDARAAAEGKARDVADVQAELAAANDRLQQSAVAAAQASEAWNGARYRLEQARQAAAAAEERAGIARTDVGRQQHAYAAALASSYEMSPALTAVSSIVQSDGIDHVMQQAATMQATESALETRYDGFRAAATLADVAVDQAVDARNEAQRLQVEAREARDAAQAAADAAAAEAEAIADQKQQLIRELADLQHVSVQLAQERQAALEAKAQAEAAARAKAEAEAEARAQAEAEAEAAQQQAEQQAQQAQAAQQQASQQAQAQSQDAPDPQPEPQQPTEPPAPAEPPAPPAPPAPSGGASAAIGFARAQLGEPYVWGADGPDAWDCSGLTMGAWNAGGKYLPHYSVAQYEQSTPIPPGSLQPGDLLFWGSSSDPSSIYHVALYIGGGQMIHAPRTGVPVSQESMYYWIPPNFYARP